MLSIDRARQFYMENRDKFPGMSMTEAVAQIVRTGSLPAPAAPAPEAGIDQAATAPVPTAAQVPAPAVPETPPAPPPYMNQYELALQAFNNANPIAAAAPAAKGAPVDYAARARADMVEGQRRSLQADVEAARRADVDPVIKDLLDQRITRADQQLADLEKDRQQAVWMAIAQAGMKMAQSQSPYFLQALASGMEAGLTGYSEEKAKAAEKKARLQDTKEEIALKKYDLRNQAIEKAVTQRRSAKQEAASDIELGGAFLKNIIMGETAPFTIESARLEPEAKKAQIANIYDTISQRRAAGARAERAAREGGGGGTSLNLKNAGAFVNSLVSENKTYAAILTDPMSSEAKKREATARINENQRKIDYVRSLQGQRLGMGSGFKILGPG